MAVKIYATHDRSGFAGSGTGASNWDNLHDGASAKSAYFAQEDGTEGVRAAYVTANNSVDSTSDRILAVFIATIQMWGANTTTTPIGTLIFKDDTGGSGPTLYSNRIEDSFSANSVFTVYGPLCSSHIVTPSATGTNTFKIEISQTTTSAGRILCFGNNDSNMVNPTQILLYYIKG